MNLRRHGRAVPSSTSRSRGHVLGALAAGTAIVLLPSSTAGAAEAQHASHRCATPYLLVADTAAHELYVYRSTTLSLTGRLDGVTLGSHAGTVALDDGRLLFVDDAKAKVTAVRVDTSGHPRVVAAVAIPAQVPWQRAGWMAVDPHQRYLAVSSDYDGAASQTITVVDLRTYRTHQVTVALHPDATGAYKETQVYLAGEPLQLVVSTGGRFEAFPLAQVLAGGSPRPTSSSALGENNHGPVVAPDGSAAASTTADGFDASALKGSRLAPTRSVAYSTSRNILQSYRPRLARDGVTVWGGAAEDTGLSARQWADTRNDVSIIDRTALTSALVRIPDGIASRVALSSRYAAVSTINPEGDALTLLDAAPRSATYRRVVGTVALPALSAGPTEGVDPAGAQARFVAMTADGARAFVSNGGDGAITVVDTGRRSVAATVRTPTPLSGGGYLAVVQSGSHLTDLIGR